ncbi:MAG: hypothetical protein K9I68_05435 [Bacteroidales bacterium]|nr:hypothetical protein [Bacteroidales bacterium]MCF8337890.1 hypothetical protein [Bacteroidales bacterium]
MIHYIEETLCIEGRWLYKEGNIMSRHNYDALVKRGQLYVVQRGGNGRHALIQYSTIPERFKRKIEEKVGDPHRLVKYQAFRKHLVADRDAIQFYANYQLQDGRYLPTERAKEYHTNAMFLNAIHAVQNNTKAKRQALGGRKQGIWAQLTRIVNELKEEYQHTLPGNQLRLKNKYKKYINEGYTALIHKGYGNSNSRKVNEALERLILSIYTMNNKPYVQVVHDIYLQFLAGQVDVVDNQTGELFDRMDFYNDKGEPITVSDATIWNYVNDPKNRVVVDIKRNDRHQWNDVHRPHMHRRLPDYSLSKISMDDRDLPRKLQDGSRVKAYYAYDVKTGAVIGVSYSSYKNKSLFVDCMRNMFRFLDSLSLGIPAEVEVEHHIVNQFKDDLMKAGVVFPFVHFAAAGNSQEKRAEHYNRAKKYGYEKRYQEGIGRFYSKLEANKTRNEKVWYDDGTVSTKEKTYSYDQLVNDDLEVIERYNNDLHRDQKRYKGMSRLDVLQATANPNLVHYNEAILARYIGEKTQTSIRRSQYVQVQYQYYQLSSIDTLSKLNPKDYTVDAYYIPDSDGQISRVHIYQDTEYIDTCNRIAQYNEAQAERTEQDEQIFTEQRKYITKFDKEIKDKRENLHNVEIITPDNTDNTEPESWPAEDTNENSQNDESAWEYSEADQETDRNNGIDSL